MSTSRSVTLITALAALLFAGAASAQPAGAPRGPADIIGGAARAREQKALNSAPAAGAQAATATEAATEAGTTTATEAGTTTATEAGTATATEAGAATATGTATPTQAGTAAAPDPHAAVPGAPGMGSRPLALAEPNPRLETGSIRVQVLDALDRPVQGADVNLGILGAQGSRERKTGRTDASGHTTFRALAGGDAQAYRVNVPYRGATYAATPFRLPLAGGYDVVIRRIETTQSADKVVMLGAAASVELGEERLKIVEQVRLVNVGSETYVFPGSGVSVKLPEGYTAFQAEESMTDQRLVDVAGEGLRVEGSLPPGQASLLWGFDLPITGSEMRFTLDVPWRGMAFRVIADAAPGMALEVEGMPPAQLVEDGGRKFWITERQWRPGEAPFTAVHVRVSGIPGPGPMRWIAAGLASLALLLGFALAKKPDASAAPVDYSARKAELLEQAASLEAQFRAGQIGPEYRKEELAQIEDALSALLWEEQRVQQKTATAGRAAR